MCEGILVAHQERVLSGDKTPTRTVASSAARRPTKLDISDIDMDAIAVAVAAAVASCSFLLVSFFFLSSYSSSSSSSSSDAVELRLHHPNHMTSELGNFRPATKKRNNNNNDNQRANTSPAFSPSLQLRFTLCLFLHVLLSW